MLTNKGKAMSPKTLLATGAVGFSLLLGGCASNLTTQSTNNIEADERFVEERMEAAAKLTPSATTVQVADEYWLGGDAFRLSDNDILPSFFNKNVDFYQLNPVSFQEITSLISNAVGHRITLSSDAIDHLQMLERNSSGSNATSEDLATNTFQEQSLAVTEEIDLSGQGLIGSDLKFSLEHDGTVSSLLDLVTSKANLFWRWDKNHVVIFRHKTKTFVLDAMPGQNKFMAEVSSSYSPGDNSGDSAGTSLSSHSTSYESNPENSWESIEQAIQAMLSDTGDLGVAEQVGTLTVTDTPLVLEQIETYIDQLNEIIGKRIAIRTEVYEITSRKDGTFGIDWDAMYGGSDKISLAFDSGIGSSASPNLQMELLSSERFKGSKAFVNALNEVADVSLVTSSSVYTVNGQPVPVQVVDEVGYLKSITQTIDSESGEDTFSLEPGIATSGLSMTLLPKVSSDGDIVMQVAMDMAQINEIREFGADETRIQLPDRSTKNFLQSVALDSGETLMITGFERTENSYSNDSIAGESAWFMGGKRKAGNRKIMTLIMLTPYIMAK